MHRSKAYFHAGHAIYLEKYTSRSEMFTELYRDEKKEEGDRGGQKDKRGG